MSYSIHFNFLYISTLILMQMNNTIIELKFLDPKPRVPFDPLVILQSVDINGHTIIKRISPKKANNTVRIQFVTFGSLLRN